MFAAQYKLSNLIAFTDYNKMQLDGTTDDIMSLSDIEGKWRSFGWNVLRCDGHDFAAMHEVISQARKSSDSKPNMIILDTIKGKGAAFAENKVENHNMFFNLDVANEAIAALGGE
jgi:transketolase